MTAPETVAPWEAYVVQAPRNVLTPRPPDRDVVVERNIRIPLRDGTLLAAMLWRPAGEGPWPVLVERSPLRFEERTGPAGEYHAARRVAVLAVGLVDNKTLVLQVRPGASPAKRAEVLRDWYRAQLSAAIPPLIAKWEPVLGVSVAEWRIKRMKTRWGTCNIQARRIWFNLELAKYAPACLEYIAVHEMVHLLERKHNDRFKGFMDQFLPQWRLLRDELNRGPIEG